MSKQDTGAENPAITAPRTPPTDSEFECINEYNKPLKLEYDIKKAVEETAKSQYDEAIEEKERIESGVNKKRSEVGKLDADVKFLKIQLKSTQDRLPIAQARFDKDNLAALECNAEPSPCTVAEKDVRVMISNNSAEDLQNLNREIERYEGKITEKEELHNIASLSYNALVSQTQPQIDSQEKIVVEIQEKYIEAHEAVLNAKADLDELDEACILKAFEQNQDTIAEKGRELEKYGIVINYDAPIAQITPKPAPEDYDCRYKPVEKCQLPFLNTMTDDQRVGCRQTITPECFEETYEGHSNADLDFWSFVYFIPALFACIFETGFDYGLCVEKSAYVLNLKYLESEMNIFY